MEALRAIENNPNIVSQKMRDRMDEMSGIESESESESGDYRLQIAECRLQKWKVKSEK